MSSNPPAGDAVLDASAILAWLQKEPGCVEIRHLIQEAAVGSRQLFVSTVNIGEVYYRLYKVGSDELAEKFLAAAVQKGFPWSAIPATNKRVWEAARLKAAYAIAYADAFAVALARERQAPLITKDPEIIAVAESGLVQTWWPEPAGG